MRTMNQYTLAPSQVGVRPDARLAQAFLTQSFFWMFLGLLVTTGVGFLVSSMPQETLSKYAGLALPLILVQLVVALVLGLAIRKISATVGLLLFFVYAAITGVTLGFVLLTYELGSIVAAGSFGQETSRGAHESPGSGARHDPLPGAARAPPSAATRPAARQGRNRAKGHCPARGRAVHPRKMGWHTRRTVGLEEAR